MRISDFLPCGRENAVSASYLCARASLTPRQLRLAIHRERSQGAPILSTFDARRSGYFLPAAGEQGRAECATYYSAVRRRALRELAQLHRLAADLQTPVGQLELEESKNFKAGAK